MAKKRRKHQIEKEEKEYKPPPFDKKEFMETEINVTKGTIIAVLLAIPMGIVAFFVMPFSVGAGLLMGFAGIGVVYFVLTMIGIEVHTYKITHWLGVISSYFFLFLAVWILLCNPPFSDQAGPDFKDVRIMIEGDTDFTPVVKTDDGNVISIPSQNVNITIWANVTDNAEVVVGSVSITIEGEPNPLNITNEGQEEEYTFESWRYTAHPGQTFTILATDVNGNDNTFSFLLILS